jgi:hypothetical protein
MSARWIACIAVALAATAGFAEARPPQQPAVVQPAGADGDYYVNSSGHRVHRPVQAQSRPARASARCRDGSYSFSEHRRGTCSHHGGVAVWY